jgi:hypothetical protein
MIISLITTAAGFGTLAAFAFFSIRRDQSRRNIAAAARQSALEIG